MPGGLQQSDLMSLEIKKNYSQLNMPKRGLGKKSGVKGGVSEQKVVKQHSAVIFDLLRKLAHIFPALFKYITGVFVLRSTQQK